MNLHRILQISKCLPPDSLHDMLFARKLSARPTETVTVSGYPCVLENSAGKPVVDYRIYGNTVQDGTPMPDNPVEVKSVGDKTKNLFNENDVTYGYWINQDGSIETSLFALKSNANIDVVTGKTICAKAYGLVPYDIAISYYDKDNAFILRAMSYSGSFVSTPPSNAAYGVFCVAASNTATIPITPEKLASYKIVLTYGESTEYYPYGYKLPVVVTGKNLWFYHPSGTKAGVTLQYSNGAIVFSGVCTESRNFSYMSSLKAGTYTLSTNANRIPVDNGNYCINLYKPNELLAGVFNSNAIDGSITFTISKDIEDVEYRIRLEYGVDYTGFVLKPQLELGTESTAYEPYHEEVTTFYLDEPLRKIGDYADVLDYNQNTIERKICKLIFTGDEDIKSSHIDVNLFEFNMTGYLRELTVTSLSSHYQSQENVSGYSFVRDMCCAFYANSIALQYSMVYIRDSRFSTIADFKAYLKEQYDAGTPVTVYYVLTESTTEPISIPSIPTFDGTTVISTDTEIQPSNMEIKYKARKLK